VSTDSSLLVSISSYKELVMVMFVRSLSRDFFNVPSLIWVLITRSVARILVDVDTSSIVVWGRYISRWVL
jgi:hypothetical protein